MSTSRFARYSQWILMDYINESMYFFSIGWMNFWKGTIKLPSIHLHICIKRVCSVELGDYSRGSYLVGSKCMYEMIPGDFFTVQLSCQTQCWRWNTGIDLIPATWWQDVSNLSWAVQYLMSCNYTPDVPIFRHTQVQGITMFPGSIPMCYQLNIHYQSNIVDN